MAEQFTIVKKFGGAGLSSIEKVQQAAKSIRESHQKGHRTIAVVSAMGKTTDELIAKAYEISQRPDRRELDMLISTGERVSMALLTMALKDLGCDAISFTGSQAGVLTDSSHGYANIIEVKPIRVEESLAQNKIVVVAGFQGVDPKTKEITTLGRGGTDTTAVALASHFKANRCEIIKEVDGIFTADPNRIQKAQLIESIDYKSLLHMCRWGAKALHYRSVELAQKLNTPVWVGSLRHPDKGTLCSNTGKGQGLNVLDDLFYFQCKDPNSIANKMMQEFHQKGWRLPMIIDTSHHLWLQGDQQVYQCVKEYFSGIGKDPLSEHGMQCVTLTGSDGNLSKHHPHSKFSDPEGEHYFFQEKLSDKKLSEIYEEFF